MGAGADLYLREAIKLVEIFDQALQELDVKRGDIESIEVCSKSLKALGKTLAFLDLNNLSKLSRHAAYFLEGFVRTDSTLSEEAVYNLHEVSVLLKGSLENFRDGSAEPDVSELLERIGRLKRPGKEGSF